MEPINNIVADWPNAFVVASIILAGAYLFGKIIDKME
jgi:hypothetical protein